MSGLSPVAGAERLRARRWDAIVLGSGVAAMVASARLGAAGHRVLVVEEDAARALHPALREPFFLTGARDGGVLDACLRELNIPLIDQRRILAERLAYQLISPKFRIDIGGPSITTEELVSWGFSGVEEASALVRSLLEANEAERKIMLSSPFVRTGRRLGMPRASGPGSHVRGLPAEAAEANAELGPLLHAQVTALSNLATADPPPEARARLLGVGLCGGAGFGDGPNWLMGLLRRRVEQVYGEFRSVAGKFSLVSVDQQPGVLVDDTGELWVGRVLIVAAPTAPLLENLEAEERPGFLDPVVPLSRRIALQLRVDREILPRGMGPRLIMMDEAQRGGPADRVMTATLFANPDGGETVDLVARMRIEPDEDIASAEDEMEARVRALMPFSEGRIKRRPQRRPRWDDDGWLEDPHPGTGWPAEVDLKVSVRPPVYRLCRAEVAGLGLEGDLLLGWRGGDAIAAELG
jgi:hypothetical protein